MKNRIAMYETIAVTKQKFCVLIVLVHATIAICIVVHTMMQQSDHDNFTSQFDAANHQLVTAYQGILDHMGSISALGLTVTVHDSSTDHPVRWPFVTFSLFPERAASVQAISGAWFVSINPLITEEDRRQFETYAAMNKQIWK
jgi:hypothetical protein